MASNKFATMLHKNTHRIIIVLIYTFLEWILILLLLLNSFFSFLISKFAAFFGLKPPCLWCSRLDRVLDPKPEPNSYRNLLCEAHSIEVSKLSYCSNHRKLAESAGMCEDCSSSRPAQSRTDGRIALFSIVKDMGVISADGGLRIENGEKDSRCSCCGKSLCGRFYPPPYLLFKHSWDVLDYAQKRNLIKEKGEGDEDCDGCMHGGCSDPSRSDWPTDCDDDEIGHGDGVADNQMLSDGSANEEVKMTEECLDCETEGEDEIGAIESEQDPSEGTVVLQSYCDNEIAIRICHMQDPSLEIVNPCFNEFFHDDRLLPIELIDSITVRKQNSSKSRECDEETKSQLEKYVAPVVDVGNVLEEKAVVLSTGESMDNARSEICNTMVGIGSSQISNAQDFEGDLFEKGYNQDAITPEAQVVPCNEHDIQMEERESDQFPAFEEDGNMVDTERKCESFIEREICDEEPIDQPQIHDRIPSLACLKNNQPSHNYNVACDSTTSDEPIADDQGMKQANESIMDRGDFSSSSQPIPDIESVAQIGQGSNHHISACSEFNDLDEERAPDTPTYIEGISTLHKRLLFERRESGPESLDGSVISEVDGGEGVTVERLKSALRSERKALSALYAELEEERSASAIAANQTMAMITRLQEEKAAMQMEALQYQRMMEEQSEYDQEALQLLNEIMVRREKDKQELEKELELYRKKVLLYESKEKRSMRKGKANGRARISSASSSAGDSDDISIDFNERDDGIDRLQESTQNTPVDEVLSLGAGLEGVRQLSTLDESLADFEQERLSILEKLKALEEKLFTLDDEEEHLEDIKPIQHFAENGNLVSERCEFCIHDVNGVENGASDESGVDESEHHERRNMGPKAKRLLPLFDAITMENEDGLHEEQKHTLELQNSVVKVTDEHKKVAIEEEVDQVYERLQALEADREFLKHCISSLKKGEKGMDLLQEILQHLRDLRSMELRVRSTGDALS
ncbi:myosin-binding protein 3-like [Magnolia sinica]|uniref:myosin-binding protein 3-like n=1 Tax=Magnolia sinica TaxID=86752 RepID=UPI00265B5830|nr:myosin-binding protein 3-like [Magnolia sinica]